MGKVKVDKELIKEDQNKKLNPKKLAETFKPKPIPRPKIKKLDLIDVATSQNAVLDSEKLQRLLFCDERLDEPTNQESPIDKKDKKLDSDA